ncbi:MAG TPA: tetratricopeptide repeat protein [Terracidiphilus sp.]|nr:tetratricopeptide repeat protein [Terracidiphilus sp.]
MSVDEAKTELFPSYCLVLLERGLSALRRKDLTTAGQLIEIAWQGTQRLPREETQGLLPLSMCCRALLEERRGNPIEATEMRARAMPLVDAIAIEKEDAPFLNMLAGLLAELGELRRAIPLYERTVELVMGMSKPLVVAELLEREGVCYARCGLKEHAAVLLRAALKILREYPGEPLTPAVLISLGNALRKSAPEEAEEYYKEAAGIYESKAQLESATTPWVNLGVLCSEQGRHAESIAHYERVLRLREGRPGIPLARIASLLNNMACARRRMGELDEALRLVDRALAVGKVEDASLTASMLGTRGQILHDAGRDAEAVEWLRKSSMERQKSSSPNLEALEENLGFEIDSLTRMGKVDEAQAAENERDRVKRARAEAPRANVELGGLKPDAPGAVLIELAFGSRPGGRYGMQDAKVIAEQLGTLLAEKELGSYEGRVAIPESVTLLFHGEDAEAMFAAMEQYLGDHCIFEGATVSIRQGKTTRQVVIAQRVN